MNSSSAVESENCSSWRQRWEISTNSTGIPDINTKLEDRPKIPDEGQWCSIQKGSNLYEFYIVCLKNTPPRNKFQKCFKPSVKLGKTTNIDTTQTKKLDFIITVQVPYGSYVFGIGFYYGTTLKPRGWEIDRIWSESIYLESIYRAN
ncbi:MAG: hypothetical protein M1834_003848 [Cirrosporium novae-zelandiae]|nr:MAG: hypothetical protein M1834_003848 [Cirrosporium novae-zelandiae]